MKLLILVLASALCFVGGFMLISLWSKSMEGEKVIYKVVDSAEALAENGIKLYAESNMKGRERTREELRADQSKIVTVTAGNAFASGVIISDLGYVVTTYTMAQRYEEMLVFLPETWGYSGSGLKADLIAYDSGRDLALMKVKKQFRYDRMPVTNSNGVTSGQNVAFFGSPNLLSSGVYYGEIASIDVVDGQTLFFVDAKLPPGSEGGALTNMYGEMIGLYTGMDEATGLCRVIAANDVKNFLDHKLTQDALKDYMDMQGQQY
ncbi:MAG: serine protease [Peptococcaceae bacterium]|nr:serine protease [Peptococcaceae bacterium]